MAELALGIISLAGLFSTCIDAFTFIRAGRSLERDLDILLVKLDIEKARLLSWGNVVGIARGINDGRDTVLEDRATEEKIRSVLSAIKLRLTDSEMLRVRYALQEVPEPQRDPAPRRFDLVSRTGLSIFRGSYNRLHNRLAADRPQASLGKRVTWAINDRDKFTDLVKDLRALVDGLVWLMPPAIVSAAGRLMEDGVASLRLSSLRLVDNAVRDEERYQALSDVVSEAIQATATDLGTVDRWLDDQDTTDETHPEASQGSGLTLDEEPLWLPYFTRLFLMLTKPCPAAAKSEMPCIDPEPWLRLPGGFSNKTMLARHSGEWHPARRICLHYSLDEASKLDQDHIERLRLELIQSLSYAHIATLIFYCPPCTYLIDTAVELCYWLPDGERYLVKALIRIDDKLSCSCFDPPTALEALRSILEHIQRVESNDAVPSHVLYYSRATYVDRNFLEARIEELEEEKVTALSATPKHNLGRIFKGHIHDRNVAGIVILGEHRSLFSLADALLVRKEPRMPRENELFVFQCVDKSWSRSRIGSFVTRS